MNTESILITISDTGTSDKQVVLEGQLTIRNALSIKSNLLSMLNCSKYVKIIFKNVVKIDLAVLQLLVALQKSASISNKALSFDWELTDTVKSALLNSGLEKILIPESKILLNVH